MRFSPSRMCCGAVDCPCTGTCFPNQFTVTIAGVTNGTCTNCTAANTTFTATYSPSDTTPTSCTWQGAIESFACSHSGLVLTGINLQVYSSGGSHFLKVSLTIGSGGSLITIAVWEKEYPSGVPCGTRFNESIPLITSTNSECNTTVATCLVTASECYDRGCVASLTEPPANFDITLDLFGDDVACGDCSTLNTTWSVTYSGSSTPGACSWVSSMFTLCSTLTDLYIELTATAGVGSYAVTVTVRDATTIYAQWSETQATPFDMASWSAASLSFDSTTLECLFFFGDPTCTATAA